ncbi:hypothetical protein V8B55DRAFT_1468053 [Mucor lusitanicus]|uniref:Enoyl reductase (ER) domain-containing protein n=2 Tax=Mucor circinelloides f. lusitanicus TaxID=29924 RepID=A0A168JCI3_MUCCL|nr:hypothetical protein FB192DRAFT_1357030 [Mucor lusitanicus]OAD01023.1 hypothetical protein MUCCIDRAFT_179938 [Mucor lusitanicus CBS 277.49]
MVTNKQLIFSKIPDGLPVNGEHIQVKETTLDLDAALPDGDFILKTLYIAVDSYLRGRMRDPKKPSWNQAFEINKPMTGDTVSVVVKSNHPNYKVDDIVVGRSTWGLLESYVQVSADYAKEAYVVRNDAKSNGLPLSTYVGALGMPGFTAWYGLTAIGKPKRGEILYVSSAASPVGQMVGQLGKAFGLRVVGSAGSEEKVQYLKSVGFDAVFNYKEGAILDNLKTHCPDGIDIYFESVGGEMLDAVLSVANNFARIIACGMSSQYSLSTPTPLYNTMYIVTKRIKFDGFLVVEHLDLEDAFLKQVTPWMVNGTIKYKENVFDGIERFNEALVEVLQGHSLGKVVVHVADL